MTTAMTTSQTDLDIPFDNAPPLFTVGQIVATPGVLALLPVWVLAGLIWRHRRLEPGDLDAHDQEVNRRALRQGGRILSSFTTLGHQVWLITEWDRSVTTILLPEEY